VATFVDQIRVAFEASGLSIPELLERAGLEMNRSSLGRKLSGELEMWTWEAEALAKALGITLVWNAPRQAQRRARRAA
jgi:ribosome-binding protein aMBF1 (putative translation factor)